MGQGLAELKVETLEEDSTHTIINFVKESKSSSSITQVLKKSPAGLNKLYKSINKIKDSFQVRFDVGFRGMTLDSEYFIEKTGKALMEIFSLKATVYILENRAGLLSLRDKGDYALAEFTDESQTKEFFEGELVRAALLPDTTLIDKEKAMRILAWYIAKGFLNNIRREKELEHEFYVDKYKQEGASDRFTIEFRESLDKKGLFGLFNTIPGSDIKKLAAEALESYDTNSKKNLFGMIKKLITVICPHPHLEYHTLRHDKRYVPEINKSLFDIIDENTIESSEEGKASSPVQKLQLPDEVMKVWLGYGRLLQTKILIEHPNFPKESGYLKRFVAAVLEGINEEGLTCKEFSDIVKQWQDLPEPTISDVVRLQETFLAKIKADPVMNHYLADLIAKTKTGSAGSPVKAKDPEITQKMAKNITDALHTARIVIPMGQKRRFEEILQVELKRRLTEIPQLNTLQEVIVATRAINSLFAELNKPERYEVRSGQILPFKEKKPGRASSAITLRSDTELKQILEDIRKLAPAGNGHTHVGPELERIIKSKLAGYNLHPYDLGLLKEAYTVKRNELFACYEVDVNLSGMEELIKQRRTNLLRVVEVLQKMKDDLEKLQNVYVDHLGYRNYDRQEANDLIAGHLKGLADYEQDMIRSFIQITRVDTPSIHFRDKIWISIWDSIREISALLPGEKLTPDEEKEFRSFITTGRISEILITHVPRQTRYQLNPHVVLPQEKLAFLLAARLPVKTSSALTLEAFYKIHASQMAQDINRIPEITEGDRKQLPYELQDALNNFWFHSLLITPNRMKRDFAVESKEAEERQDFLNAALFKLYLSGEKMLRIYVEKGGRAGKKEVATVKKLLSDAAEQFLKIPDYDKKNVHELLILHQYAQEVTQLFMKKYKEYYGSSPADQAQASSAVGAAKEKWVSAVDVRPLDNAGGAWRPTEKIFLSIGDDIGPINYTFQLKYYAPERQTYLIAMMNNMPVYSAYLGTRLTIGQHESIRNMIDRANKEKKGNALTVGELNKAIKYVLDFYKLPEPASIIFDPIKDGMIKVKQVSKPTDSPVKKNTSEETRKKIINKNVVVVLQAFDKDDTKKVSNFIYQRSFWLNSRTGLLTDGVKVPNNEGMFVNNGVLVTIFCEKTPKGQNIFRLQENNLFYGLSPVIINLLDVTTDELNNGNESGAGSPVRSSSASEKVILRDMHNTTMPKLIYDLTMGRLQEVNLRSPKAFRQLTARAKNLNMPMDDEVINYLYGLELVNKYGAPDSDAARLLRIAVEEIGGKQYLVSALKENGGSASPLRSILEKGSIPLHGRIDWADYNIELKGYLIYFENQTLAMPRIVTMIAPADGSGPGLNQRCGFNFRDDLGMVLHHLETYATQKLAGNVDAIGKFKEEFRNFAKKYSAASPVLPITKEELNRILSGIEGETNSDYTQAQDWVLNRLQGLPDDIIKVLLNENDPIIEVVKDVYPGGDVVATLFSERYPTFEIIINWDRLDQLQFAPAVPKSGLPAERGSSSAMEINRELSDVLKKGSFISLINELAKNVVGQKSDVSSGDFSSRHEFENFLGGEGAITIRGKTDEKLNLLSADIDIMLNLPFKEKHNVVFFLSTNILNGKVDARVETDSLYQAQKQYSSFAESYVKNLSLKVKGPPTDGILATVRMIGKTKGCLERLANGLQDGSINGLALWNEIEKLLVEMSGNIIVDSSAKASSAVQDTLSQIANDTLAEIAQTHPKLTTELTIRKLQRIVRYHFNNHLAPYEAKDTQGLLDESIGNELMYNQANYVNAIALYLNQVNLSDLITQTIGKNQNLPRLDKDWEANAGFEGDVITTYVQKTIDGSASSPLTDTAPETTGGIDFKHQIMAKATTYEAMGSFAGLDFSLPKLSSSALLSFNLDKEQSDISRAIDNGILVSGQRIKEFMAASFAKGELDNRREAIITWLAQLGILEETQCCTQESSKEYREALVIADSAVI
ncbi:MAG: hypothetical protein PHT50_03685 [Candidatus Omnitrophica bacterium]|nr:hypothetical protein [Candidatus Omnitrophota bacterium]